MSKFFKTQNEWVKKYPNQKERTSALEQAEFHKVAITKVKKSLGKDCTFLAHTSTNGVIGFTAHFFTKGKKKIVDIEKGVPELKDLTAEHYAQVREKLITYVRN